PPWSASPTPSNSTASPSEAITLSTAALKVRGESTENGIASRAIQSSSVACVGVGRDMDWSIPNTHTKPYHRSLHPPAVRGRRRDPPHPLRGPHRAGRGG